MWSRPLAVTLPWEPGRSGVGACWAGGVGLRNRLEEKCSQKFTAEVGLGRPSCSGQRILQASVQWAYHRLYFLGH